MVDRGSPPLIEALALVAPGTPLRDGLNRVLLAKRGALVVVGDDPAVLSVCTGGFLLDAEFSPQRLSELAKMDGAIILASDASRIARANVHLVPKASIPTSETGTRHRTAERLARSIGVPVISVSEAMATIAIYRGDRKHTLQSSDWLVDRATQALATLQQFKTRFDLALSILSTLEVEDSVSVRDVVRVIQPGEMVVRINEEIEEYLVELGEDGRLLRLQLEDVTWGADQTLRLVVRDYEAGGSGEQVASGDRRVERRESRAMAALRAIPVDHLLGEHVVGQALGRGGSTEALDAEVSSRGYRLLHRVPRLSEAVIQRLVDGFGTLPEIMRANVADLERVGGVGAAKARSVKVGLSRLVEASILERYE